MAPFVSHTNPFPSQEKYLLPGDVEVRHGDWVLKTVVGSCISVCIWDRRKQIGGMNHFLLPEINPRIKNSIPGNRYGDFAMETLFNELKRLGSQPTDMIAMVIGGANTLIRKNGHKKVMTIGSNNAIMAVNWLRNHRIRIKMKEVGGVKGRRITFYVQSGRISVFQLN